MGTPFTMLIVVCPIIFFTFATFFGRLPQICTPTSFLFRSKGINIVELLNRLDRRFTKGRIAQSAPRLTRYLVYKEYPIVLIFFVSVLIGGSILFVPAIWPLIPWYHKIVISLLLPLPHIFIHLCNKSGPDAPHIITISSYTKNVSRYPYDYKLFHPNIYCKTCQFPKPARSKHCSLCRACVARADHHCIWVNNCLGRGNYKYFLALLLSTAALLAYVVLLAYLTLKPQVKDHYLQYPAWHAEPSMLLFNSQLNSGRDGWANRTLMQIDGWLDTIATALLIGGFARCSVGLLALLTAPLPAGLFAYHTCLIWAGMTTNESAKWNAWREEIVGGLAYVAPIAGNGENSQSSQHQWDEKSAWPKRSRQFLVLTSDGLPPRNLQPEIKAVVGEHVDWRRCRSLKEVDNIYNLGVWQNLTDVLL
ncbi:zf-DHHC-domain-containing protein, partial [Glonium stellatum]